MNTDIERANYEKAKQEADKVDLKIIELIKKGKNFRVEAGAGSGKTYSLNKTIEWLQDNKIEKYNRNKQNVVCITYTNAAVNVISSRLRSNSFIIPSTIHSFAWNAIKQYQSFLISSIKNDDSLKSAIKDNEEINIVEYTLGKRYVENGIYFLHHNDVLKLFCNLLDNNKYRRLFANKYPLILIDEYQDSYKSIIDQFIKYFISDNISPQFGFFGDSWQTIYQTNNACGLIEHENIEVLNKISNFRCPPKIVDLLNKLRPELEQISAVDGFDGEIFVITCEDYKGERRSDRNFNGDLPVVELKERISKITKKISEETNEDEKTKVLMITHKVLANQQGYEKLLDILDSGLKEKEDVFLLFFMNVVEPIYKALETNNTQLLFDTLGSKRNPIVKKSEKQKWKKLYNDLTIVRNKTAIDVINLVKEYNFIPLAPELEKWIDKYYDEPDTQYFKSTIKKFLDLDYEQFLFAIDFLYPNALFSTDHGVKGEEYDNVVFAITRGWNNYKFDEYAPMMINGLSINTNQSTYERVRNLFYVCCSRPKKRLYLFVSIPINTIFKDFLTEIAGEQNYLTYSQFINN